MAQYIMVSQSRRVQAEQYLNKVKATPTTKIKTEDLHKLIQRSEEIPPTVRYSRAR